MKIFDYAYIYPLENNLYVAHKKSGVTNYPMYFRVRGTRTLLSAKSSIQSVFGGFKKNYFTAKKCTPVVYLAAEVDTASDNKITLYAQDPEESDLPKMTVECIKKQYAAAFLAECADSLPFTYSYGSENYFVIKYDDYAWGLPVSYFYDLGAVAHKGAIGLQPDKIYVGADGLLVSCDD